MVTGAGLEPAQPIWPVDFECLAPYSRYIPVHTATKNVTNKAILAALSHIGRN